MLGLSCRFQLVSSKKRFYTFGVSGSLHFSITSVSPLCLKLTFTCIDLSHLNGNMLSYVTHTGRYRRYFEPLILNKLPFPSLAIGF